jgi:hypothetical protein
VTGRQQAAADSYRDALRCGASREESATIWSNLAKHLDDRGDPVTALRASVRATRLVPGHLGAWSGMLWYALRCEDRGGASEAVRGIAEATEDRPEMLDEVAASYGHSRRHGARLGESVRLSMVRELAGRAGPAARRILDVLA